MLCGKAADAHNGEAADAHNGEAADPCCVAKPLPHSTATPEHITAEVERAVVVSESAH